MRPTLRQSSAERARELLQAQPGREMLLGELIDRLVSEFRRPKHTFYQYLSKLGFLETVTVAGGKTGQKLCRLKNLEGLAERVGRIRSTEVRSKLQRALSYLNEDEVDIGLFLLSKEFEATLRTFLESEHASGRLVWVPGPDPSKWRLGELTVIAERSAFITDAAAVSYLRQERNERAHGSMPTAEERAALLRAAPTLAGLYVDYVAFFVNQTAA